ncbi:hypothetical protein [Hymenobacter negativus]|uniref:hypothetical protein n=1 Tax=Hymenobacter negativus TaxID=2795026 RepID=UPI0018DAF77B|nr:hypothetical protein [Hymenobacter negativus]MBH8569351.1 hypothetical protein [Hymenobacter negativus]
MLLRRTPIANTAPATGYTVFVDQYDLSARRPYRDAYQALTNTGAHAAFELAVGALVPGASFCVNQTQRQVKYAGDGQVSTHDVPGAPACVSSLRDLVLTTAHASTLYAADAYLTATWAGGAGPLRVRCALLVPGTAGAPDFYTELSVPAGTTTAVIPPLVATPATAAPSLVADVARYERLATAAPAPALTCGRYRVEVLEETGGILAAEITVLPSLAPGAVDAYKVAYTAAPAYLSFGSAPFVVVARFGRFAGTTMDGLVGLYSDAPAAGNVFTRYAVRATSESRAVFSATLYNPATGTLSDYTATVDIPRTTTNVSLLDVLPTASYCLPAGTPIGTAGVYSNGQGGVVNLGSPLVASPRLALANLVYFHPPTPTSATGGVVVEAVSFDDALPALSADEYLVTGGPFPRYALLSSAGAELAANSTGRFGGLLAGAYTVRVRGQLVGGPTLDVPVTLTAAYGLKYRLRFVDVRVNKACRLELWARGYAGPVLDLCGQAEPVTLETEGFAGGNTQADLPNSIGSSLTMRLKTAPGELADLLADDRACRADFYYDEALEFTGYVQPDIYEEPLVGTTVAVELTATDGLAALKDVDFAGHVGQELRGRRPVLDTLLHCLSRTGLALPVAVFTNRRALEMSSDEQPETALYTDRLAYAPGGKPMDLRAVLNALAELLGGTLVQRNGRWEVRSALEMAGVNAAAGYVLLHLPAPADLTTGQVQLLSWLVPDGATVTAGQSVAEIQYEVQPGGVGAPYTITEFLAAPADGVLTQTAAAGSSYPAGSEIGDIPIPAHTLPVPGRAYDAAGDHATATSAATPAHRIVPARLAGSSVVAPLFWREASQRQQRRAGWRYLTAGGDATYAGNAFRPGDYFSDAAFWDASGTALRPETGWQAGSAAGPAPAASFPLRLVEAGAKAEELATQWPQASSRLDSRYLESELAPVAADAEGVACEIRAEAKFYYGRELSNAADVLQQLTASLWVEVHYRQADGQPGLLGAVLAFPVAPKLTDGFTTATARLPLALLPGGTRPRVRVHAYTYTDPLRAREGQLPAVLLLKSVAVQLLPQGASWNAAESYYASGAGGSVRPAGLDVFHVDAPQRAGLFGGVAHAFRRSVTRGPAANPASAWARADDLKPAPLLAAAVLDTLALRANPSRMLTGTVKHQRRAPAPLDAVDAPYDAPGRRFAVGARTWHVKSAETEAALVEIGPGEALVPATLPPRVLLVRGRTQNRVRLLLSRRGGVRAIR